MRAVLDTGVLVSAFISRQGAPGQVLAAARSGRLKPLFSAAMLDELLDVLSRPHMQRKYHIGLDEVEALLHFLQARGEPVVPREVVRDCRDPKDNKFLEAALAGQADCLVTGDEDLRVLHPWRGIAILTPAQLVEQLDA
jgi:putative PIN family toxin of toxin-antitoxin system